MSSWRDLTVPRQKKALKGLLQGILISELIKPSRPLWIVSGWVSDIQVIDNTTRQFSSLQPDWEQREIRFSEVLCSVAQRGGLVGIVLRDVEHNYEFVRRLQRRHDYKASNIFVTMSEEQHAKGIIGERGMIGGSMNLTHNGITINEEDVTYRCDPASIHEKRLTLHERWSKQLPW